MYQGDSFFTLNTSGQVALVSVSLIICALVLLATWHLTANYGRFIRLFVAVFVFWLFVWLSPQFYYFFYWLTFDGLPLQIVLKSPPTLQEILRILTFSAQDSLSAHGQALLGWALILAAIIKGPMPRWR